MKKISAYIILLTLFFWGCPHHKKTYTIENPQKDRLVIKELFIERIKSLNCDGSDLDVQFKKGDGMFQNMIVVSGGNSIIIAMDHEKGYKVPVPVKSDFLVNKTLDYVVDGDWDSKCVGARHTIIGNLKFFDYEFRSDADNPLVFMMTDRGYQYLQGKGEVEDLLNGEVYTLAPN